MHICLFEDKVTEHLRPLVDLRPVYDLRCGMHTPLQRARLAFPDAGVLLHSRAELKEVCLERYDAPTNRIPSGLDVLFLNGRLLIDSRQAVDELKKLAAGGQPRVLTVGDTVAAAWVPRAQTDITAGGYLDASTFGGSAGEDASGFRMISRMWHLLDHLPTMLAVDYARQSKGYNMLERTGVEIHESVALIEPEKIFIAPGVRVFPGAVISAENGPVYIDASAVIAEHTSVRGPAYIGKNVRVKAGAHVDVAAIGKRSKVGGEVHDSIIHSYSNKAHHGYLGDSYIGCWCNLGAGTNTSNLRNDYGETAIYNMKEGDFEGTGRQFTGLFLGDHSKAAIATRLNTASVIGTYCNLLGEGFQPRYVPSFSWGNTVTDFIDYRIDKALDVAAAVLKRRDVQLTEAEESLLRWEYARVAEGRSEITVL